MANGGRLKGMGAETIVCWNCDCSVEVHGDMLVAETHPPCGCGQEISARAILKAINSVIEESKKEPLPKLSKLPASATDSATARPLVRRIPPVSDTEKARHERMKKLSTINATFVELMKKAHKV